MSFGTEESIDIEKRITHREVDDMDEDTNISHPLPEEEDMDPSEENDIEEATSEFDREPDDEEDEEGGEEQEEDLKLSDVENEVRDVDEAIIGALTEDDDSERISADKNNDQEEGDLDAELSRYEENQEEFTRQLGEISGLLGEAGKALEEVAGIREAIAKIDTSGLTGKADLSTYRKKLSDWKGEGYNIERLLPVLDVGIDELAKRMFDAYERDVARLHEIESSLDGLETTGFKKKEADIRDNLKNPDEIALTLKHLIELEIEIRRKREMDV